MPVVSRPFTPLLACFLLSGVLLVPSPIRSEDAIGLRQLRTIPLTKLDSLLPVGTHILIERKAIEAFLKALEGVPPNWTTVYGGGHHDPGHDDRLFNLNRERDLTREGNPVLNWRLAFIWSGELSRSGSDNRSYTVAVGPEFNVTSWGLVRFKPEDLPGNLQVRPDKKTADRIHQRLAKHQTVQVIVVMVGTLIPSESIIYDFSHDEEGVGLIMPVVRVEHVEVVLKK
jgi:hypothetical protein